MKKRLNRRLIRLGNVILIDLLLMVIFSHYYAEADKNLDYSALMYINEGAIEHLNSLKQNMFMAITICLSVLPIPIIFLVLTLRDLDELEFRNK